MHALFEGSVFAGAQIVHFTYLKSPLVENQVLAQPCLDRIDKKINCSHQIVIPLDFITFLQCVYAGQTREISCGMYIHTELSMLGYYNHKTVLLPRVRKLAHIEGYPYLNIQIQCESKGLTRSSRC